MAKMKYKHTSLREARHIAKGQVASAQAIFTKHRFLLDENVDTILGELVPSLSQASEYLRGRRGVSREEQGELLKATRSEVASALKLVDRLEKAIGDKATDQDTNLIADLRQFLSTARDHLTAALALSKSRKYSSTREAREAEAQAQVEPDVSADESEETFDAAPW